MTPAGTTTKERHRAEQEREHDRAAAWGDEELLADLVARGPVLASAYPPGSRNAKTINPTGDWRYIGRGPVQVTHRYNYDRARHTMEEQARRLQTSGNDTGAKRLTEVAAIIRADPREAARPANTFLFSAAYAKPSNLDRPLPPARGQVRSRALNATAVTGGAKDPQAHAKQRAFERALATL